MSYQRFHFEEYGAEASNLGCWHGSKWNQSDAILFLRTSEYASTLFQFAKAFGDWILKLIFSIHGMISKVPAVDIYMYIPTLLAAADENGPRNASPPHVYTYYRKFLVYTCWWW